MTSGVNVEISPLDDDHVRAKLTWSEQDVGGGTIAMEVTVNNPGLEPKTQEQIRTDAIALAMRLARTFAYVMEN